MVGIDWLLAEAKANHVEFCSGRSGATAGSLKTITRSLGKVKRDLGVHRQFSWTDSYYQYANRLATLWFLRMHNVPARLLFVYFTGDVFPDGRECPATAKDWQRLIEARRLTLGLPKKHVLSAFEHHVFLPAQSVRPVTRAGSHRELAR